MGEFGLNRDPSRYTKDPRESLGDTRRMCWGFEYRNSLRYAKLLLDPLGEAKGRTPSTHHPFASAEELLSTIPGASRSCPRFILVFLSFQSYDNDLMEILKPSWHYL
ncbi:hypothetical protein E3N88_06900 [Mikania micrantha]|uniref:Uncharacterized protein n=1 Tax=Mikania micrantha TaxID=192012 RepID=A0A5N6PPZ6_9ASTR|nr:hypothetical protein E3N88_06900 [Mikania micrantha]